MTTLVTGMFGFGDTIYSRPVICELAKRQPIAIETAWPELYEGTGISCLPAPTLLRTQVKNMGNASYNAQKSAVSGKPKRIMYDATELRAGKTILQSLERSAGVQLQQPIQFGLPRATLRTGKFVLVRPVTLRREWLNEARAPKPEYLVEVCDWMRERGYKIVSVADCAGVEEWLVHPAPKADTQYHAGELSMREVVQLAQSAAAIVGGVGFIVPLSMATVTPLFCVLGGQGAYNRPEVVTDPRLLTSHIGWAKPDKYCMCSDNLHKCVKTISNLREQWEEWITKTGL